MKVTEFENGYIKRSNMTLDTYRERFVTLPCDCGESECDGYAAVGRNNNSIKAHVDIFMVKIA